MEPDSGSLAGVILVDPAHPENQARTLAEHIAIGSCHDRTLYELVVEK